MILCSVYGFLLAAAALYEWDVRDRLPEPERSEYWQYKHALARLKEIQAANTAAAQAALPHSLRERLQARLQVEIMEHECVLPTETQWGLIFSTAEAIWAVKETPPPLLSQPRPPEGSPLQVEWDRKTAEWPKARDYIFEAIVQAMAGYIKHLRPVEPGPFQKPLEPSPSMIYDLVAPFRAPQLKELGLCQWITDQYNRNVYGLSKSGTPPIQPQNYAGPRDAMADIYLRGTPLLPLMQVLEPFQPFTDEMRFAHYWCLGKTGRGKTTFLRHLIKDDLDRVARGECSLVVVDSKKLIREMRTLEVFAEGQPLDGCLTLIDSDVPFPLNPFYLPEAQARAVLVYMLAGMTEASGLQTGALAFLIDAAMKHDKPSLRTIRDFFKLDARKGELPAQWSRYDKDTQDWFKHTFKNLHAATREGLHQRLANFIKEYPNLNRMFEADSFGIDINELHKGGKVLLVDTDLNSNGEDGTNLLGRLIIGLIEQLSTTRNKLDEGSLKPVWLYIDEAGDYLKTDSKFEQILTKARSSKIGATVAYQYRGQVDPKIEKALDIAEIHSECVQKGTVELTIAEKRQHPLTIRPYEFSKDEPQMVGSEYQRMREHLAFLYPYTSAPRAIEDNLPLTEKNR